MRSFLIEGKGKGAGNIKIDDSTRQVTLSYQQYSLINEVFNHYLDKFNRYPDREEIRQFQSYLVTAWISQDKDTDKKQWLD